MGAGDQGGAMEPVRVRGRRGVCESGRRSVCKRAAGLGKRSDGAVRRNKTQHVCAYAVYAHVRLWEEGSGGPGHVPCNRGQEGTIGHK